MKSWLFFLPKPNLPVNFKGFSIRHWHFVNCCHIHVKKIVSLMFVSFFNLLIFLGVLFRFCCVSFRFVSACFVSFLFRFLLYNYPALDTISIKIACSQWSENIGNSTYIYMIGTIQVHVHYNEEAASSSAAWKGGLCRCIVSCNPINHVTKKILGRPTSKKNTV